MSSYEHREFQLTCTYFIKSDDLCITKFRITILIVLYSMHYFKIYVFA